MVIELVKCVLCKKLVVIGFCFGGAMVWWLLVVWELCLVVAVLFYGLFFEGGDLCGNCVVVLGVYGGIDTCVNVTIFVVCVVFEVVCFEYEIFIFIEVGYVFFNNIGTNFNLFVVVEVWRCVNDWFGDVVECGKGCD